MAKKFNMAREFKTWVNEHIQGEEIRLSRPVTIKLNPVRWGNQTVDIDSIWKRPSNGALYLCSVASQLFSIANDLEDPSELNDIVEATGLI